MDRIRKALDLARLERGRPAAEWGAPPFHSGPSAAKPADYIAHGTTTSIVYTQTRVFTPAEAVLERHRILTPASSEGVAAAFRMLRTQVLQRMDGNGWRSLAVLSAGPEDGKTTTAINLAVSLASGRLHTVLLVDFDFKSPKIAACWDLDPEYGVDDVLLGDASIEECLYHPEGYDRLVVLPARAALSNSSELLAGPRGRALVAEVRKRYPERIIVFDLPPILTADDALAFAPLVECGLVVASEGRTRRKDLVRTIELLVKTPILGTVLNRASDITLGT